MPAVGDGACDEEQSASSPITRDLYIEFDESQLTVTTDIPEVHEFLRRSFEHMLVPRVTHRAGSLTILKREAGVTIQSAESRDLNADPLEALFPLIKDEVRLQFMRVRPDLLWLHAGAVERQGVALLLAGRSGQGKSTLTTRLCDNGWNLLSDDIAPVRMDVDEVIPFYQLPVRRLDPGRELSLVEMLTLGREFVAIPRHRLSGDTARIGAMVFLNFTHAASPALSRLSRGEAALEMLRNATNFVDHKRGAVARAALLTRTVPGYRLIYGSSEKAVALLDELAPPPTLACE